MLHTGEHRTRRLRGEGRLERAHEDVALARGACREHLPCDLRARFGTPDSHMLLAGTQKHFCMANLIGDISCAPEMQLLGARMPRTARDAVSRRVVRFPRPCLVAEFAALWDAAHA